MKPQIIISFKCRNIKITACKGFYLKEKIIEVINCLKCKHSNCPKSVKTATEPQSFKIGFIPKISGK